MSNEIKKLVIDLSKPKGKREQYIALTQEEIANIQIRVEEAEAKLLVDEAEAQDKADAKASGVAKLSALGLSDAEIAAITGA